MKKYFLFFVLITSSLPVSSQLYFKEVSSSIDFNHTYYQGISGAGLSFVDFNLDGYDDLTVPTNSDQSIYFFINDGNKLIPKYKIMEKSYE